MKRRYLAVLLLLIGAVGFVHAPRRLIEPEAKNLRTFPTTLGEWRLSGDTLFDHKTLRLLRPSDYLMRTYVNKEGDIIGLYVGYHNGGKDSGPIHSPKNCLPSSGWLTGEHKEMLVRTENAAIRMVRAAFSKNMEWMTCYYWYQVRGKTMTSDFAMKFAGLTGVFFSNRKDASFIRLDVFSPPGDDTDRIMRRFVEQAFPLLQDYLPS